MFTCDYVARFGSFSFARLHAAKLTVLPSDETHDDTHTLTSTYNLETIKGDDERRKCLKMNCLRFDGKQKT